MRMKQPRASTNLKILEEDGRAYGRWFHLLMRAIDFRRSPAHWQVTFETAICHCPQRIRGEREWKLFLNSGLCARIRIGLKSFFPETTFKHLSSSTFQPDLCVFAPMTSELWAIDWKTDEYSFTDRRAFLRNYTPQITSYQRGLARLNVKRLRMLIYSSASGDCFQIGERKFRDQFALVIGNTEYGKPYSGKQKSRKSQFAQDQQG